MYCNKCGREIPDNSLFCPFCGKDLSDVNDMLTEEKVRQSAAVKPDISNNETKNENVRAKRLGIPEENATVKPKRNVILISLLLISMIAGQSLNLAIPIHLADKIYNEYIQKSFSAEESGKNTASSSSDVEQENAQLEEYVLVKDIEGLEYRIPSGWDDAVISRNGANTYSVGNATLTISYKPINIGVYKQEGSDLEVCKMLYEEYISRLKIAGFQVREEYVNYSQTGKSVVGTMNFARIKNNDVANFTALISTSYTDAYLVVYSVKDGFVVEDEFKKQVQEVFDSVKVVAKED